MAAGVPGMRIKVAEIKPPLVEPTYIDTKRISALVLSIKKVSGNVSAITMPPLNPGMAPTTTPTTTPVRRNIKGSGVNKLPKELIRCSIEFPYGKSRYKISVKVNLRPIPKIKARTNAIGSLLGFQSNNRAVRKKTNPAVAH